ncbi:hypothetical protein CRYUN_Cryun40dG0085500 [Craigia yunnanensis]
MLVHIVGRTRGLIYDLKRSFTLRVESRNSSEAQQRYRSSCRTLMLAPNLKFSTLQVSAVGNLHLESRNQVDQS